MLSPQLISKLFLFQSVYKLDFLNMWSVYCIPVQILGSTWLSSFILCLLEKIRTHFEALCEERDIIFMWQNLQNLMIQFCFFHNNPLETLPAALGWATRFSGLGLDTIFSENLAVTSRWVMKKSHGFQSTLFITTLPTMSYDYLPPEVSANM